MILLLFIFVVTRMKILKTNMISDKVQQKEKQTNNETVLIIENCKFILLR